jgi:hypothetical protein
MVGRSSGRWLAQLLLVLLHRPDDREEKSTKPQLHKGDYIVVASGGRRLHGEERQWVWEGRGGNWHGRRGGHLVGEEECGWEGRERKEEERKG